MLIKIKIRLPQLSTFPFQIVETSPNPSYIGAWVIQDWTRFLPYKCVYKQTATIAALIIKSIDCYPQLSTFFPNWRDVAKPVVVGSCSMQRHSIDAIPSQDQRSLELDTNERDVAKAVVPVTSISNDVTRPTCPDSGVVFHTTPFHHKFTGHSGLDTLLALQVCVQADSIDCYPAYD